MKYFEAHKFGGSPLADSYGVKTFVDRLTYNVRTPAIILVSAFKNMTNLLEHLCLYIHAGEKERAEEKKDELLKFHLAMAYNLFPSQGKIFERIVSIIDTIYIEKSLGENYSTLCGRIMGLGEDLSSVIISEYLKFYGVENELINSRDFIVTDTSSNSNIIWGSSKEKIVNFFNVLSTPVVIMQGFVGRDPLGRASILKREDSDLSAVVVSIALDANLFFWKKRAVSKNFGEISFRQFVMMEAEKEKLLSDGAIKVIQGSKKSFMVINFDQPEEKTFVHF